MCNCSLSALIRHAGSLEAPLGMGVLLMMPQIHLYVIYLYSLMHWV